MVVDKIQETTDLRRFVFFPEIIKVLDIIMINTIFFYSMRLKETAGNGIGGEKD